jgi:hypothetical protein
MTIADVFFTIGRSHRVCEDYGVAGTIEVLTDPGDPPVFRKFAFIADGCSSAKDSDFGARLLCRAAAEQFGTHARHQTDLTLRPGAVIWKAVGWRESLGLHPSATDATLLAAMEDKKGNVEVVLYGDGVIAAQRRDGTGYDYWQVECARNAPSYLSYLTDDTRLAAFRQETGGLRTVTSRIHGCEMLHEDEVWLYPEGEKDPGLTLQLSRADYTIVAIMSDGVESFRRMEGTSPAAIPLTEVLDQFMDFSTASVGFVQREMRWLFRKWCVKKGWWAEDDVAVGALALDAPEESS